MADTIIPQRMIDGYKKLKKTYPDIVKKFASSTDEQVTKNILDEMKDLFKTFDQGLSGLMKSAKTTDKPEKAREILEKIVKVTNDYEKKTDKIAQWALKTRVKEVDKDSNIDLSESDVKTSFKIVSMALASINAEATKALKQLP